MKIRICIIKNLYGINPLSYICTGSAVNSSVTRYSLVITKK